MQKGANVNKLLAVFLCAVSSGMLASGFSMAASAQSKDFALQVSPSPIVTNVKPGTASELELKIRNAGSTAEELKIEPRSFSVSTVSEEVKLNDTTPPDIADWISFSEPKFKVQPGEWYTQKVKFSLPKDTGFSYSFALIISRQSEPKATEGGRLLKGSVAVFTLVNVDRPGAKRKIEVGKFTISQRVYEFLPATINIQFKNTGNTIVQPYGNIFIQRGSKDKTPIATLPVNEKKSYILPGNNRTLVAEWEDGFPVYKSANQDDGVDKTELQWDWTKTENFRFGLYTAKLVAVYNDGSRDIPIEGEVTFWVVPWRSIIVILVLLVAVWLIARWRMKKRTEKAVKKALERHRHGS